MASINNLEVKGVKFFPDHEGAMIPYGNIYLNGKKVGAFRTDSWGGPMQYDHTHKTITEKEVNDAFHGIITKLGWHEFYDSMDILVEELIELKEFESSFKKAQKNGRILMVVRENRYIEPYKEQSTFLQSSAYTVSEKATEKDIKRFTKEILEEKGRGAVTTYRSLEDFVL